MCMSIFNYFASHITSPALFFFCPEVLLQHPPPPLYLPKIPSVCRVNFLAGKGSVDLVEDLLRAGADPSARIAYPPPRSTPLHSACRSTRLGAVKALLLAGADETIGDMTPPPAQLPAPPNAPPPPSTTPLGVVGLGNCGRDEDPTLRLPTETAAEHARRRDPQTMEAIRMALRCARLVGGGS